MVSFSSIIAGGLALGAFVQGSAVPQERSLKARALRTDLVLEILKAIGVAIAEPVNTWEFQKYPQFCDLYMETRDGGHCYATVECQNGGKMFYKKDFELWEHCSVGSEQTFEDPRIGKFAIKFRTKDGYEGQGLTEPLLTMENVANWKPWDVTAISLDTDHADRCEKGITPVNCDDGPFVCRFVTGGNKQIQDDRVKRWSCGVPIKGEKVLDDMEWKTL